MLYLATSGINLAEHTSMYIKYYTNTSLIINLLIYIHKMVAKYFFCVPNYQYISFIKTYKFFFYNFYWLCKCHLHQNI